MNWDTAKSNWNQLKGKARARGQWGGLTDDDLARIEGKRDQLIGRVQERYGIEKDEAEKQVKQFETRH